VVTGRLPSEFTFMTNQPPPWQCEHLIPSQSGAGRRVQQEILDQLTRQLWGPRDVFSIHLAMEEALSNAIKHGNRCDPSKSVRIRCLLWPDRVRIEIADEGAGFRVSEVPDPTCPERIEAPTGRGVMLMRSFMSRVEYNELGNQVVMEKERSKTGEPSPGDGAMQGA
jgi:serine/threonine-protein kinase RsbW